MGHRKGIKNIKVPKVENISDEWSVKLVGAIILQTKIDLDSLVKVVRKMRKLCAGNDIAAIAISKRPFVFKTKRDYYAMDDHTAVSFWEGYGAQLFGRAFDADVPREIMTLVQEVKSYERFCAPCLEQKVREYEFEQSKGVM